MYYEIKKFLIRRVNPCITHSMNRHFTQLNVIFQQNFNKNVIQFFSQFSHNVKMYKNVTKKIRFEYQSTGIEL